jgi:hypothetical protein
MEFKEGKSEGEEFNVPAGEEVSLTKFTVKKAPEYEDVEGEEAYGVYSEDTILGVFWNKEFANIFKEAIKNVEVKVTKTE